MLLRRGSVLAELALDCGRRNAVASCDLSDALAAQTILLDGGTVQVSGVRPIRWPSSLARRMPARTRSMMRLRSNSAMAPMMTTMARPSGPPVSIFSRKLMNSTPDPVQIVEHIEEVAC